MIRRVHETKEQERIEALSVVCRELGSESGYMPSQVSGRFCQFFP